ncbi:MAG: hypothetical protein AB7S75_05965 [Desulfococcaceae bacterium]
MISNTSKYIPYESVSSILLVNEEYPDIPFFGGTGFFVYFPSFEDIFFITARHCVYNNDGTLKGKPKIHYDQNGKSNEVIPFSYSLGAKYSENDEEFEDILVYVVDNIPSNKKNDLFNRSLRLQHQDDVDTIIQLAISNNTNLRTVGFPSVSKEIDYEKGRANIRPRGFYAKVSYDSCFKNRYKLKDGNWKDGELNGFSGSPILELVMISENNVQALPLGVLLTESYFISINVATNVIAEYIKENYKITKP